MKRSVVNSPGILELKHKRNKTIQNKIIIFIISVFVFFVAISIVSNLKELNINKIKISGNIVVDSDLIEETVKEKMEGNYFFIFPKTNFLIYPQKTIEETIKSEFKRIKNISINDKNVRILQIDIEEYEGKYLYCGETSPQLNEKSLEKCYFMDSVGYIFDEAPFFSGDIYFKFYGHLGKEEVIGNYYDVDFIKLIQLKESLEKTDLKPLSFWLNSQNEIYINLSTLGVMEINPSIILKKDFEYEKTFENLRSAITTDPLKTKLEKNYSKLNYIDLRFGNKVYYKFE